MAQPRDIRRLAFQGLFQLGAAEHTDDPLSTGDLRDALEHLAQDGKASFAPKDVEKALALALGAYEHRRASDAFFLKLAPEWPAHRQPAVDRAILRLAYHEIAAGHAPPRVAVNEAVELAKKYSTERSPAFVNGLLDKAVKQFDMPAADTHDDTPSAASPDASGHPAPSPDTPHAPTHTN